MIIITIVAAVLLYATLIYFWTQQQKPKLRPMPINKRQHPSSPSQYPHS
jgi:hypothetical protein